ncbi:MAG: hypothetical protein N4A59_08890 [Marinifilum sp.]|jgi:hypothetical protein|nr:hypothetical protein [Marinifilum sp.]
MKYILLLTIVLFSFSVKAQIKSKVNLIPERYAVNKEKPLQFTAGDTLIIQCDTVFVINKIRYQFYQKLHDNILSDSYMEYEDYIATLKNELAASQLAYDELKANCDTTAVLARETITNSIISLDSLENNLKETEGKLSESIKKLDGTKDLLGEIKTDQKKDRLFYSIGGVAIGILTGILVTN